MIEPIRGTVGAYDISCSGCGVVERFEKLRLGLLLFSLRAKGWRVLSGRHYCPECEAPVHFAATGRLTQPRSTIGNSL